jgi:hypothetical protein
MSTRPSPWLVRLSLATGGLAAIAALVALLAPGTWSTDPGPVFTTTAGTKVELFGRGLYRHDSLLAASTYLGTDLVTVLVMLPVLGFALLRAGRGSLHARLLLAAALGFFVYNGAHLVFAVSFNPLFLVYVALFGCGAYALARSLTTVDLADLERRTRPGVGRGAPAVFLAISGVILALVWLSDLVPALPGGPTPAAIGAGTTLVTYAIDLGIVVPATLLAAVLLRRGTPAGTLVGVVLLVIQAVVGVVVAAQTLVGLAVGADLPPQAVVAFVVPFLVLAAIAILLLRRLFRAIED